VTMFLPLHSYVFTELLRLIGEKMCFIFWRLYILGRIERCMRTRNEKVHRSKNIRTYRTISESVCSPQCSL